jgi:hypothetical protein
MRTMKPNVIHVVLLDGRPICGGTNQKAVIIHARNLLERERLTILDEPSSHPEWTVKNTASLCLTIPHAGR